MLARHLVTVRHADDPGDIAQRVEPPELGGGGGNGGGAGIRISQVSRVDEAIGWADQRSGFFKAGLIDIDQRQAGSGLGQLDRGCAAQPRCCARDQRDLARHVYQ